MRWITLQARFIPVDAISRVDQESVHISTERTRVAGAPVYDPEVVPERRYYEDLYGYYEYPPFWAPGYMYPGFRR